jgi:hypothetical protein
LTETIDGPEAGLALKSNPHEFLGSRNVSFAGINYGTLPGSSEEGVLFQMNALLQPDPKNRATHDLFIVTRDPRYVLDVQILPDKPQFPGILPIRLAVSKGGPDTGVRFLRWQDNKLTGTVLDENASLVFTGPLQGCNVYVATVPGGTGEGETVLMHANANDAPTEAENEPIKAGKARDFAADMGGARITHRLSRADYAPASGDPYNGFVYGQKQADGSWNFFAYTLILGASATSHRLDPLHPVPPTV